ncbi:zinc finger protein-domain-containing protein [Aspergillus egyptiacus]|nr:zinc finger protein-domain-containing protein [Aspergillus egyptiacus]
MNEAKQDENNTKLRRIGAGFCGTVWASTEQGSAFKREDGGHSRSLINDYNMHGRIFSSAAQYFSTRPSHPHIQIPRCYELITPTHDWWASNLSRFPDGYQPCNTIHAQRIPTVSEATRRLLVERYCPTQLVSEILDSDTNRDCLIRPYLGRRRTQTAGSHSRFKPFSLRNYPLHIDQMEEMGISEDDLLGYARIMAEALAVMHWAAGVDGNDVEFVLAAPNDRGDAGRTVYDNALGRHQMWLLDFDLVREMTMDEEGVRQAVKAFRGNDPFYPRPGRSSLWEDFKGQYLETSKDCISAKKGHGGGLMALPDVFISCVEDMAESGFSK